MAAQNSAVAVYRPGQMAAEQFGDKLSVIQSVIAVGCTPDELDLFAMYCAKTQLDPFAKQIYAIKRKQRRNVNGNWVDAYVMTIQVGIDGARAQAERTGLYRGQLGPYWYDASTREWLDVWIDAEPPAAAKVGILREDFTGPLWAVARFDSYAATKQDGTLTGLWASMPEVMIAKCAEMLALRKGFPDQLAGLYSPEEMQQADNRQRQAAPLRGRVEADRKQIGEPQHRVRADEVGQQRQAQPPEPNIPPKQVNARPQQQQQPQRRNTTDFRARQQQTGASINEDGIHRHAEAAAAPIPLTYREEGEPADAPAPTPPAPPDEDAEDAEDIPPATAAPVDPEGFITENTRKRLYALAGKNGWDDKELHRLIGEKFPEALDGRSKKPSVKALTEREARRLCDYIEGEQQGDEG